MAKFKIYLINTRTDLQSINATYNLIPISEFNNEYQENFYYDDSLNQSSHSAILNHKDSFCYTYNEKFQKHQNTQRTLTFSMNAQIIRADRIEKNPFTHYLFVGSQLLLVDKYDKHHLMTVSKISYEFKELNTVFNYECQDSFNYQLARQNTGYEITNDLESTDFIGANSLDWWVLCKIHPECNISYAYIPLTEDLKVTEENDARTIKDSYPSQKYPEFHKTIPFSGSGTASSVLIALGEMYGLQLAIYERVNFTTKTIQKYYWFEPMKSLKPTGLKYSPKLNLQSFGLEHNGNALSSILNVQSHYVGEELITLIPSVPGFFKDWFKTYEWKQSSYFAGLFTSSCQQQTQHIEFNSMLVDVNTEQKNRKINTPYFNTDTLCLYIPLDTTWFSKKYDYVRFNSDTYHSILTTSYADSDSEKGIGSITHNAKSSAWELIIFNSNDEPQNTVWSNETVLPHELLKDNKLIYLKLPIEKDIDTSTITLAGHLYITQFRNATSEELEFAKIADQLPWLENRLVNFQYFYEHSIIGLEEFNQLMSMFENDLRKVNATLLIYSQEYYQQLQAKTKVIAELSAKLDKVGVIFQSDFIDSFASDGHSRKTTEFNLAMSDLFSNSSDGVSLINYYETLGDYVNKYISAEQTFLKNIYLFKTYFDAKSSFGTLYEYTFSMPTGLVPNKPNLFVSFSNPNAYVALNEANSYNPIFEKVEGSYVSFDKTKIASSTNGLYYLNPARDNMVQITPDNIKQNLFTKDQVYYEEQWIVTMNNFSWPTNNSGVEERKIVGKTTSGDQFEFEKVDSTIYARCYKHCLHTTKIKTFPTVVINNTSITPVLSQTIFVKTNLAEMRINYLYKTGKKQNNTILTNKRVHIRQTDFINTLCSIDNSSTNSSWANSFNDLGISWKLLQSQANSKNWSANRLNKDSADEIYKECFPVTSLYWYGYEKYKDGTQATVRDYHSVPLVNIENCVQFQRRVSISLENYQKHQVATCVLGGVGLLGLIPFLPFGMLATIAVAPAFWGISSLIWNNGEKPFDCSGWTYHDVFNCDYDTFQGWCGLTDRLIYTTNGDGYRSTNQRGVFPTSAFNGETWIGTDAKINGSMWGYNEAKNLLFTYQSLTTRLAKNDAIKYHYKTTYWRLLTKNDYINRTDSLYVLYVEDMDAPANRIIPDVTKLKYSEPTLSVILDSENDEITLKRLNSAVYYPLKNSFFKVSATDFIWPDDSTQYLTIDSLLAPTKTSGFQNMRGVWNTDSQLYDSNMKVTALFFKAESWQYRDLKDYSVKTDSNEDYVFTNIDDIVSCSSQPFYDNVTHQQINWLTDLNDLTLDFYVSGVEDEDYVLSDTKTVLDDSYEWYEKTANGFERRYTLNQLIQQGGFYVKMGAYYTYQSFSEIDELRVSYSTYEKINDNEYKLLAQYNNGKLKKVNSTAPQPWRLYTESDDVVAIIYSVASIDLDEYTNGMFWYIYRNNASSVLREKAMSIETNLTEYWTNAYYASKNCKYFLPEYWQPTVNHKTNYFSSDVLSATVRAIHSFSNIDLLQPLETASYIVSEKKTKLVNNMLVNEFVITAFSNIESVIYNNIVLVMSENNQPSHTEQVTLPIFNQPTQTQSLISMPLINVGFDGTIQFRIDKNTLTIRIPVNTTKTGTDDEYQINIKTLQLKHIKLYQTTPYVQLRNKYIPTIIKLPNQPQYLLRHKDIQDTTPTITAQAHNLKMAETAALSAIAQSNDAIQSIVTYLDLKTSDWHATKIRNDYTWYYATSGGETWPQTLETLSSGAIVSDMFGGWYDMMIRVLQSCNYINYIPQQYYQAQEGSRRIWSEIYKKYGHLIYEQSYTNEDATTSEDLLNLSQYAFKDYTQVESNYNISVIDINTLKGYKSQELKIGDGIELDADELYSDKNSDIYRSLIQYLYITDINYDLRRDDNIQLTVNSIKYQDKVIGQLIKLIR